LVRWLLLAANQVVKLSLYSDIVPFSFVLSIVWLFDHESSFSNLVIHLMIVVHFYFCSCEGEQTRVELIFFIPHEFSAFINEFLF
jgi:hypothetical protein